jgi:hypothetical protein
LAPRRDNRRDSSSNDNPFSEAQFKTLKYCPQFPERFGSLEDGRAFGQSFFPWYHQVHRHGGLGFLTPAVVHFGQAIAVRAPRQHVLALAYAAHPERFVNGRPLPADLPTAAFDKKLTDRIRSAFEGARDKANARHRVPHDSRPAQLAVTVNASFRPEGRGTDKTARRR